MIRKFQLRLKKGGVYYELAPGIININNPFQWM